MAYNVRRGRCNGTWRIKDSISLSNSSSCYSTPVTEFLTNNTLVLGEFYLPSLLEYIGHQGTPYKLWTSIVAGMVWLRFAAVIDENTRGIDELQYSTVDHGTWTMQTVQRSWIIYFILALQPLHLAVTLHARVFLFPSPVTEGFGTISLLAGLRSDTAGILRGASLSGKLSKVVRVQMVVWNGDDYADEGANRIEYILNGHGDNDVVIRVRCIVRLIRADKRIG